ncbi:MAG: hypothetical protein IJ334_05975 [Clostridia bacterium]|nr:hypothetical protein [Clostridia bacterium]
MAEKMNIVKVFGVLLRGGYIVEIHYVQRKTEYTVHVLGEGSEGNPCAGHITQKQFHELCQEDILRFSGDKKDEYGNIYNFYELQKSTKDSQP